MECRLVVHDTRWNMPGSALILLPAANAADSQTFTLDVNSDAPLSQITSWIAQQANANNGAFVRLQIVSHCFGGDVPPVGAWDSEGQDATQTASDGTESFPTGGPNSLGFGIQLGSENLTLQNCSQLQSLSGLLDWIEVRGCGAAAQAPSPGGVVTSGDGKALCQQIAQVVKTSVQASSDFQYIQGNGTVAWTGTVYTFDANGNVVNTQTGAQATAG